MMGEGGGGDGRGGGGVTVRDIASGDDHLLTWPRRSYSPGSFEDVGGGSGGGGGYTPDCSSNENLTSSEDDFSSGQSSHVSPSPTTAFRRPFREKSRSPSQNSQNSQHSFDSSSPPTPQSQKRPHRQPGGHVVMSEATIVSVRKTGQIWPPTVHHDQVPHGRVSHDSGFTGDHLGECRPLQVMLLGGGSLRAHPDCMRGRKQRQEFSNAQSHLHVCVCVCVFTDEKSLILSIPGKGTPGRPWNL